MRPIHKRTDSFFLRCVAALLFLAACAWGGAWLSARLRPLAAAPVFAEAGAAAPRLRGFCLRREEALHLPASAQLLAEDAARIPGNGVLAILADGSSVTARESALYFAEADGFEALGRDSLTALTPAAIRALRERAQPTDGTRGRLVYDAVWYYAALLPDEAAPSAPQACRLRFAGFRSWLPARLVAVGSVENGERALLFRLSRGGDYLRLREIEAEARF